MDDKNIRVSSPIVNITTLQMMKAGFFFGVYVAILAVVALISVLSFSMVSKIAEEAELKQEVEVAAERDD